MIRIPRYLPEGGYNGWGKGQGESAWSFGFWFGYDLTCYHYTTIFPYFFSMFTIFCMFINMAPDAYTRRG